MFVMLYKQPSIDEQRSRNLSTSYKNSVPCGGDFVVGVFPSLSVVLRLMSSSLLPDDTSRYESKHKMQSSPALANTRVFSDSRKMRKMSMTLEMFTFFVVKVPKSGRQPDLMSAR